MTGLVYRRLMNGLKTLLGITLGSLFAPLVMAWAVVAVGYASTAVPLECAKEDPAFLAIQTATHGATQANSIASSANNALNIYIQWLQAVGVDGKSWSCDSHVELLARVMESTLLVGGALLLALLWAGASVALAVWKSPALPPSPRPGVFWFAPTMLWAAAISVGHNAVLLQVDGWMGFDQLHRWLFPRPVETLRTVAALATLALGSGTYWDLRHCLHETCSCLVLDDQMRSLRANGMATTPALLRNMLSPLLTRIAGRLPLLFGELIVVESIFQLDGVGRSLQVRAEEGDAPALMTLALGLVFVTLLARAMTRTISGWLHPVALTASPGAPAMAPETAYGMAPSVAPSVAPEAHA